MEFVTSADGTRIAFERLGRGRPLIVVGGATRDRVKMRPLSEELAKGYAVLNYDRRGRGESGDADAYSVAREVEDIQALIAVAGGTASLYGHSSGAALALNCAAAGASIDKLVLHEAPYGPEDAAERSQAYGTELRQLLGEDRRADAVELFMTYTGAPPDAARGRPARSTTSPR